MQAQPRTQPASVLVVDDDEANRSLARHALENEGYRVILAASGPEALSLFEVERPDCVLLDVRLPGMDGFTVCEQLRGRGAGTPVIFLTALRNLDTFDRALRVGGDDFLTKPVQPAELVVRVQACLTLLRLRAELREYCMLLRRQRDALLRLQLQKERLMSFLLHDLKNPVNSMDLQAQLLMRSEESTLQVRNRAGKIREEARCLTRMLLNLLDLSMGDEGQLTPKRADLELQGLVAEVIDELEPSAQERTVRLQSEVQAARTSADADLLRRSLANLIENAIRHAPANSTVRVQSRFRPGKIELRVLDAGPGVPADMREKVFDPFVQVETGGHTSFGRSDGRGLGLAFCKLTAEAHDGHIWVEDGEPGAVFCMSFSNRAPSIHPECHAGR